MHHLQLLDGGGAVDVAGHQKGPFALLLKVVGQLGAVGGFTGALEAAHQDDGWDLGGEVDPGVGGTHKGGHLVVYDLDDLLGRGEALQHLLPYCLFGDRFHKILGHLIVDVRLQEGKTHLPHGFLYIRFAELAPVLQFFEGCGKLFGKPLKGHGVPSLLLLFHVADLPGQGDDPAGFGVDLVGGAEAVVDPLDVLCQVGDLRRSWIRRKRAARRRCSS